MDPSNIRNFLEILSSPLDFSNLFSTLSIINLTEEFPLTIFSQTNEISFSICVPVMIYHNVDLDKLRILKENKGLAGVYLFSDNKTGKSYVGSSFDLSRRLKFYFSLNNLERTKNMYICRALLLHGYSSFSLSILDYVEVDNLSKDQARLKILKSEQFYISTLIPEYNILKVAGSMLGFRHTEESKAKFSENNKGENHPFFGQIHSIETLAKMSLAKKGTPKTEEHKALMSEAMKGIAKTEEHKAKISIAKGVRIYVYSSNKCTILNSFSSSRKAAEFFKCSHPTINIYVKNGKLFKKQWILSLYKK